MTRRHRHTWRFAGYTRFKDGCAKNRRYRCVSCRALKYDSKWADNSSPRGDPGVSS